MLTSRLFFVKGMVAGIESTLVQRRGVFRCLGRPVIRLRLKSDRLLCSAYKACAWRY